ncbi:hypothetical protein HPG69_000553 [Diceros bicornis minor]|uniref:Solute carrier family 13 member 1 n=1 Tax=Diceros bicornis minor TaxID=77932 RepID=A0A7J7FHY2_DICBM|nr:hypothetical protein HPG69_000553 [Diceros bicornis minor]
MICILTTKHTHRKLTTIRSGEYISHLPSSLVVQESCELVLPNDRQKGCHLYFFREHFSIFSHRRYPDCQCINFGSWFIFTFPAAVIILLLSWIWLQWLFLGFKRCSSAARPKQSDKKLVLTYQEIVTLVLFILMALLWFSRDPGFVSGWSVLFSEYLGYVTDSTVALLVGLLFFLIPAKRLTKTTPTGEIVAFDYSPLITWKEFQSFMPWDIAILVGGGFALADGCEVSGLSEWIGNKLSPIGSLPLWLVILLSSLMVTSLTEVASNPATITLLLPILSPLAEAIHVNPLYILIPSTLCTSFAFLLPVANPPNAIVFSYGHLTVIDMVKAGLGVNIVGVAVVMLGMFTWIVPMFDLQTYPSWAPEGEGCSSNKRVNPNKLVSLESRQVELIGWFYISNFNHWCKMQLLDKRRIIQPKKKNITNDDLIVPSVSQMSKKYMLVLTLCVEAGSAVIVFSCKLILPMAGYFLMLKIDNYGKQGGYHKEIWFEILYFKAIRIFLKTDQQFWNDYCALETVQRTEIAEMKTKQNKTVIFLKFTEMQLTLCIVVEYWLIRVQIVSTPQEEWIFSDTHYVSGSSPERQIKTSSKETNKTILNESVNNFRELDESVIISLEEKYVPDMLSLVYKFSKDYFKSYLF